VKTNCVSGTSNQISYYGVALNVAASNFSYYYKFASSVTLSKTADCCSKCFYDLTCWVFDHNIVTRVCNLYDPDRRHVDLVTNGAVFRNFLILDSNRVSGYYN
jgi:hypothetical protein